MAREARGGEKSSINHRTTARLVQLLRESGGVRCEKKRSRAEQKMQAHDPAQTFKGAVCRHREPIVYEEVMELISCSTFMYLSPEASENGVAHREVAEDGCVSQKGVE